MVKRVGMAASSGLLLGVAISVYAHSGHGLETAPLVVLALSLSGLGTATSGALMVIGERGKHVVATGAFSLAMLVALVVLPLIWPYPASQGPRSLEELPSASHDMTRTSRRVTALAVQHDRVASAAPRRVFAHEPAAARWRRPASF
jgi:hypothetical protein